MRASFDRVKIRVPSRFHMGLLAMSSPIYCKNGGLGYAFDGIYTEISSTRSSELSIVDLRPQSLQQIELSELEGWATNVAASETFGTLAEIVISGNSISHSGLGTGTAIRLAIIESLLLLNGGLVEKTKLIELSRRGGTSGVGIATYFEGGMVADLGHKLASSHVFSPSSFVNSPKRPTKLLRVPMPDSWVYGVTIPKKFSPIFGEDERRFFDRVAPVTYQEASSAVYDAIFGVLGGLLDLDFERFSLGVQRLQDSRWKQCEISMHEECVSKKIQEISRLSGGYSGMSSLGPSVYFGFPSSSVGSANFAQLHSDQGFDTVLGTANNSGRGVQFV